MRLLHIMNILGLNIIVIIPTCKLCRYGFQIGAVFCLFMPLCLGLSLIIEPVFSEENFSKDILRYKPNIIMGATSLWLHFLNNIKGKEYRFIIYYISDYRRRKNTTWYRKKIE